MTETNEQLTIFKELKTLGCCPRCILRFTFDIYGNFENPEQDINKLNLTDDPDESLNKKAKPNSCLVCLDLLQDYFIDQLIELPLLEKALEYDSQTFNNFISFPTAVLIRDHSMEVYLKDKYPDFYKDHRIFAINKAWSLSIYKKLEKRLEKKFDRSSTLQIQFEATYYYDDEESAVMHKLDEKSVLKRVLSRNTIGESLKSVDSDLFKAHVTVPPEIPSKAIQFEKIDIHNEAVYIAGRYCKYSRKIGQSPWIVNNKKVVENSVQDIIFEALEKVFNCKNLVFSSSGREDVDVRTLGRGRPFFIRINDSTITKLPFEIFREIEDDINATQLIRVRHLQFIDKNLLTKVKAGEQFKRKTYRALCIVNKPENRDSYIATINKLTCLKLQQKTPVRVYHRRTAATRIREIYTLSARLVKGHDNLFELDMETQAGTYVKEFVHGDLGRTKPNLQSILGEHVDIVSLDVLDVDLDFPPEIKYSF